MVYKYLIFSLFICGAVHCSSQTFTEVALSSGINHVFDYSDYHFGGGAAVLDFNNDGFEDVYITGGSNPDVLYRNNGNGTFTDVKISAGIVETDTLITIGAVAGDINNDGWVDLFISVRCPTGDLNDWANNLLYLNNGNNTFTEIGVPAGIAQKKAFSTSAVFGDYDKDGFLDLYVLNFLGNPIYSIIDTLTGGMIPGSIRKGTANFLYHNNGNGTFTEVATQEMLADSGAGWATIFSDYDRDSDLDLYVANDFGSPIEPNALYKNNYPNSGFSDVGNVSGTNATINAMGVDAGDFNEDGYLDYYVTDLDVNILYMNNGNGVFTNEASNQGVRNSGWSLPGGHLSSVSWGVNFFDFDHDTYLDIFVCNGSLNPLITSMSLVDTFYNPNAMFRNNGAGSFNDVSNATGLDDPQRGRGSVIFDYDNDGDMDLLVVNQRHYQGYGINENPKTRLYRNENGNNGNWLKVKLQGVQSNFLGIGSMVEISANGRKFIRESHAGSSHLSNSSPIPHFGLGSILQIDTLKVYWPSGIIDVVIDISPNQEILIVEGQLPVGIKEIADDGITVFPNPTASKIVIHIPNIITKETWNFRLIDSQGKVVRDQDFIVNNQYFEQDLTTLASGLYIYIITNSNKLVKKGKIEVNHK